jgi:hypothetical protein
MTLNEAAKELGLDASTLRRQIANGRLKAVRVGPPNDPNRYVWMVTPAELKRYREQSLGKAGRPFKRSRRRAGSPAAALPDASA